MNEAKAFGLIFVTWVLIHWTRSGE